MSQSKAEGNMEPPIHFFALPRELRDMIYTSVITSSLPLPTVESTTDKYAWQRIDEGSFAQAQPPLTCATFLATNRQINSEMLQALDRAWRAETLVARLDCIVRNGGESGPWFTWLSIPLVHRSKSSPLKTPRENSRISRLFPSILSKKAKEEVIEEPCVSIEELQLSIRLSYDEERENWTDVYYDTKWAICSVLKRICQHKDEYEAISCKSWPRTLTVNSLVLNVVSAPFQTSTPILEAERRDSANSTEAPKHNGKDHAKELARELINMWSTIWAGSYIEPQYKYYTILLERIKRVRVCVDGMLIGERELRLELERGQAERRRIALRVGW